MYSNADPGSANVTDEDAISSQPPPVCLKIESAERGFLRITFTRCQCLRKERRTSRNSGALRTASWLLVLVFLVGGFELEASAGVGCREPCFGPRDAGTSVLSEAVLRNPVKGEGSDCRLQMRRDEAPQAMRAAPASEIFVVGPDHVSRHWWFRWFGLRHKNRIS